MSIRRNLGGERPIPRACLVRMELRSAHFALGEDLRGADGNDAVVFYKAVQRESGRAEFIVGPDSLGEFQRNVAEYAEIGLKTFALGDPDGGGTASMRVMQTAMDKGLLAAIKELPGSWLEAAKDPKWVAHTVIGVATSAVPAARSENVAMKPQRPQRIGRSAWCGTSPSIRLYRSAERETTTAQTARSPPTPRSEAHPRPRLPVRRRTRSTSPLASRVAAGPRPAARVVEITEPRGVLNGKRAESSPLREELRRVPGGVYR